MEKRELVITAQGTGFSTFLGKELPILEQTRFNYDIVIAAAMREGVEITIHNIGSSPLKLTDGVARILAKSIDKSQGDSYNADITAVKIPALKITSPTSSPIQVGTKTAFTATKDMAPCTGENCIVTSRNGRFNVTVDEGHNIFVTPTSAGTDVLTLRTDDGIELSMTVTAESPRIDMLKSEPRMEKLAKSAPKAKTQPKVTETKVVEEEALEKEVKELNEEK